MRNALLRRGFTLLELIVTIVVLGVLATTSVPAYTQVVERASLETDKLSLSTFARQSVALAAFNGGDYSQEILDDALAGTGADWERTADSQSFGEFAAALDGTSGFQAAMRSTRGSHCLHLEVVEVSFTISTSTYQNPCRAAASEGPGEPGPGEPVNPGPVDVSLLAPQELDVQVTSNRVRVSWSSVPDVEGYNLYEDGTLVASFASPHARQWEADRLPGRLYRYNVEAYKGAALSPLSQDGWAALKPQAPVLTPTSDIRSIRLSWPVPSYAAMFTLERSTSASMSDAQVVYSGPASSFSDTGLEPLKSYFYRLKVETPGGSATDAPREAKPLAPVPAQPVLSAAYSSGQADLSWNAVPFATEFRVYRGSLLVATLPGSALGWSESAPLGSNFQYRVTASNPTGQAESNTANVLAPPAAPKLTATLGVLNASLSWTPSPTATHYILRKSTLSVDMRNPTAFPSQTTTTRTDVSLTLGLLYHYQVTAYNAAGSTTSNVTSVLPLVGGLLG